jgi:hypothetical protein
MRQTAAERLSEGAPMGEGQPVNCTLYHTIEEETKEHEVEIHCNGTIYKEEETKDDPGSGIFFLHGSIVIILVLVAGSFIAMVFLISP